MTGITAVRMHGSGDFLCEERIISIFRSFLEKDDGPEACFGKEGDPWETRIQTSRRMFSLGNHNLPDDVLKELGTEGTFTQFSETAAKIASGDNTEAQVFLDGLLELTPTWV